MKILDITDFYSERGGGIRSHLTGKGHSLARQGLHHVVVAPGARDETTILRDDSESGGSARLIRVGGPAQPYDPSYHFLLRLGRVRRLIAEERPDVLEINSLYLAALSALSAPRGSTVVRTCFWHSDHVDTFVRPRLEARFGATWADRGAAPFWAAIRGLLGRFDGTICASRWQKEKLERHGISNVFHIPFGVDQELFTPDRRSEETRRELVGAVEPDALVLLAVGRLSVEKEWPVVIDAFRRLREHRKAVLIFLGDGPERAALEARSAGLSEVRFLGFEADRLRLAKILASSDLLIHACPYETFGLGVAEAIACGLPVVVPDQGGAAENADGPHAETFRAGDAGACAEAVERLLAREGSFMKDACQSARGQIGTMEDHFAGVAELYRNLVARAASR